MNFHDVRFPTHISRGSEGGPERRTDVVVLGSGHEQRNARWYASRRVYNAGYGVRSIDDLNAIIAFFEERRGRLFGFRWRDHLDWKSCPPSAAPSPLDQVLGTGNGTTSIYQIVKTYGSAHAPYVRDIAKPVAGTVRVAVAGSERILGTHFSVDHALGRVTFLAGQIPAAGASVTAGYEFDVPVRFDADRLEVSLTGFEHGAVPSIPIVEVRT
ncbi:MAG: DUF2460 domain-containing protein [Hyphomicrobium sp.]|nr:DUF2460 domain-containing protein [Hyphomicrobium sp.]